MPCGKMLVIYDEIGRKGFFDKKRESYTVPPRLRTQREHLLAKDATLCTGLLLTGDSNSGNGLGSAYFPIFNRSVETTCLGCSLGLDVLYSRLQGSSPC